MKNSATSIEPAEIATKFGATPSTLETIGVGPLSDEGIAALASLLLDAAEASTEEAKLLRI